ncbi:MAG: hypothetical protein JW881_05475 [Spirochaetales bacterium]|nr:hypothetical protein [Spirochaetales bacterium]
MAEETTAGSGSKLTPLNVVKNLAAKVIVAYLFALAIPIAARLILQSHLSIPFIVILVMVKPTLILVAELATPRIKRACIVLSGIFSVVFALLLTVGILITPANSYRRLFQIMQTNFMNPGRVVNIFILFIAFFSTTFACTVITHDFGGAVLGMFLIISALAALVFQMDIIYGIFLAILFFVFIYNARKYLNQGSRVRSIVFSCLVVTLCFLIGYGLQNVVKVRESDAIDEISTTLRGTVSTFFPQIPLIYEIPEFGFSFEDEYKRALGATPILSSIPLFEVEGNPGDTAIYLRTRIHSTFTNDEWQTPAYTDYHLESQKYGSSPKTGEGENDSPIQYEVSKDKKKEGEIRVTVLGEYYAFLPHTLDTVFFRFKRVKPMIVFGDYDTGFYLDDHDKLISNDTVYLRRGKRPREDRIDADTYLDIPYFVSNDVRALAEALKAEGDPRLCVRRIREYLSLNCIYNLETGESEARVTLIDGFLFERKGGYSVHFTTAFIFLARLNGIPARYATGFLAILPQPNETGGSAFAGYVTTINGYAAHVWPEVYYNDTGWTIEEATPAVLPFNYHKTESGLVFDRQIMLNQQTQRQLSYMMGRPIVEEKLLTENWLSFSIDPVLILYGLVPIMLLLLFIRYFYMFRYMFIKNRKTLIMLSRKIVRKQQKKGIDLPETIGWIEWGERIKESVPKYSNFIDTYIQNLNRIFYGASKVVRDDVKTAYRFFRKVKAKKQKKENQKKSPAAEKTALIGKADK